MVGVRDERGALWRICSRLVWTAFRLCFRVRVAGASWVPWTGPAIVAANHVSALDGIALAAVVSERRRRVTRYLVAAEFFERWTVGWALRAFRQIPLRRGERDAAALEEAVATVRRGALVGIFPEGRVGDGAGLQPGRRGVARIAVAAGTPVVPTGIWGTQRRWPRRGLHLRRPWRPALAIVFGLPLAPEGDPGSEADLVAFVERVMAAIADQVEAARELAEAR